MPQAAPDPQPAAHHLDGLHRLAAGLVLPASPTTTSRAELAQVRPR